MSKQQREPRFIQIGGRAIAVAHIVSVEFYTSAQGFYVHLSLTAPTTLSNTVLLESPNVCSFTDDEARSFVEWWDEHGDVRKLRLIRPPT